VFEGLLLAALLYLIPSSNGHRKKGGRGRGEASGAKQSSISFPHCQEGGKEGGRRNGRTFRAAIRCLIQPRKEEREGFLHQSLPSLPFSRVLAREEGKKEIAAYPGPTCANPNLNIL